MKKWKEVGKDRTKLDEVAFLEKAIVRLRKDDYRGIHTVYSGINSAFGAYYADELKRSGKKAWERIADIVTANPDRLSMHPARGGAMLYLAADAPARKDRGADALKRILD